MYIISILWAKIGYKLILLLSYQLYEGSKEIFHIGTMYQHIQKDFECTDIYMYYDKSFFKNYLLIACIHNCLFLNVYFLLHSFHCMFHNYSIFLYFCV